MRARIIFRGLTLFEFSKGTAGAKHGEDRGELTAWLISDPKHQDMPLHHHKPYLGLIGRNVGSHTGVGRTEKKRRIPPEMRIELHGHNLPPREGVKMDQSFIDYVPRLGDLRPEGPTQNRNGSLYRRKIVIPTGTIRAREFISWDWRGNTPAKVGYMDTPFQGYGANEVIVDIGDDSDIDDHNDYKYLSLTGKEMNEKLWPRTKGGALVDDIDPNTVELQITNLTARRRRPVFWGLHFQLLFEAAGFAPRDYTKETQFLEFVRYADDYDPDEWRNDSAMGMNHPFPFIIDPRGETLPAIRDLEKAIIKSAPPTPPGRQKKEGIPKGGHEGHDGHGGGHPGHTAMGHDPQNTEICPFGKI
jgi:hypothetical protein